MKIDVVFGTRPEWLKLFPVIRALELHPHAQVRTIFTGQQPDLVRPLMDRCGFQPDVVIHQPDPDASLGARFAFMVGALDRVFAGSPPDRVIVQGDTLSTFAAASAAGYGRLPVAHVEAGLRTRDLADPFPEEFHRVAIASLAALHYCPTPAARDHLLREGVPGDRIVVTGNTSIDMLRLASDMAPHGVDKPGAASGIRNGTFLVTMHRRENIPFLETEILPAFRDLLEAIPDLELLWILHPGPSEPIVRAGAATLPRTRLVPPMDYFDLLALLPMVRGLLTDSGGLTEESAALGVPALIVRKATERIESLVAGNAVLLGNTRGGILTGALAVMSDPDRMAAMARPSNVFGDGHAAERIASHLLGAVK
jgi:UDP-N-acetylglucosamine 2-epimerase (non-hydrolysing)